MTGQVEKETAGALELKCVRCGKRILQAVYNSGKRLFFLTCPCGAHYHIRLELPKEAHK
jgi:hypothetical protein